MTPENGFTVRRTGRWRFEVVKDGKTLTKGKWVWTKKGPQFNPGFGQQFQNYK
jgi:hypothetical protein